MFINSGSGALLLPELVALLIREAYWPVAVVRTETGISGETV